MDKSLITKKILVHEAKIELIQNQRQVLREKIIDLNRCKEYLLEKREEEVKTNEPEFVKVKVLMKPFMGKMYKVS